MRYGYFLAACLAAQFAFGPAFARSDAPVSSAGSTGRVAPAFAGHYYLSGIMETGSELLLREDGSFEWYLSYGALDQYAKGTWRREGDSIVLTAHLPDKGKPLFAYLDTQPWSAEAEQARLDREHDMQEAAIRAACPFLADYVSTAAPVPTNGETEEEKRPTPEELRREAQAALAAAQAALAAAQAARSRMEDAARRIMAGNSIDEAATGEAQRVTAAWYDAADAARSAAYAAGLPPPDLSDPVLPSGCAIPERQTVERDAPGSWKRALAAQVIDSKSGEAARGVKISLRSGHGPSAEVITSGDGMALLPDLGSDGQLTARLSASYAEGRDVDIRIPPVRYGIVRFSIDTEQLMVPPFERFILRIDGAELLPEAFGQGRYKR